jgi:transposase
VARSRVELFEQIRKDHRVEGASIRELADRHHVHRRTVRLALESAVPPPRKPYPRRPRPAIDAYAGVIDSWLLADKQVPRKQRHTARRVKLWMFVLRLSCSGRAFHVAFATQAQEAFLEGHVLAFEQFGAVPGRVRYDNLRPAVIRVLKGRDRAESERFIALRSHYSFDSFFCIPGKDGAHEKGSVEGEIGRFRRRHLTPVPSAASLAALNQQIAAADIVDDGRVITGRPVTVAAAYAEQQPHLLPLPAEPFDAARLRPGRL